MDSGIGIALALFMVILIFVAILRWVLRINDIVDGLYSIYKKLEEIEKKMK
jgi:hypothetical protein